MGHRYRKHDTARRVYIDTVAMPALRLGKLPPPDDWRMLFLPGDGDTHAPDRKAMDEWAARFKTDPRSKLSKSYQVDAKKQEMLLKWVSENPAAYLYP